VLLLFHYLVALRMVGSGGLSFFSEQFFVAGTRVVTHASSIASKNSYKKCFLSHANRGGENNILWVDFFCCTMLGCPNIGKMKLYSPSFFKNKSPQKQPA